MSSAEESRLPRGGGAGQLLLSQSSQDRPHQLPLGVGQLATMARYLQFLTEGPVLQLRKGDSQSHRLLRKTLSRICQGFQGRDCVALQRLISTREGAKPTRHCREESTVRSLATSRRSLKMERRDSWCSSARGPSSRSVLSVEDTRTMTGATNEEENPESLLALFQIQTQTT